MELSLEISHQLKYLMIQIVYGALIYKSNRKIEPFAYVFKIGKYTSKQKYIYTKNAYFKLKKKEKLITSIFF